MTRASVYFIVEHDANAATARAAGRERDIVENFTDKRMDVTVSS